ncbi:hypothetical protein BDD12DRAFT_892422 [Trichophaea hybrida]|nr:hypothetical protein BDD12DRAFT_892422 [Trichophaea hybrida]
MTNTSRQKRCSSTLQTPYTNRLLEHVNPHSSRAGGAMVAHPSSIGKVLGSTPSQSILFSVSTQTNHYSESTSPSGFTDSASQSSGHDKIKQSQLQPLVAMSRVTRSQGKAKASTEAWTASALASTSIIRGSYEIRTTRALEKECTPILLNKPISSKTPAQGGDTKFEGFAGTEEANGDAGDTWMTRVVVSMIMIATTAEPLERNKNWKRLRGENPELSKPPGDWRSRMDRTIRQQAQELAPLHPTARK